MDSVDTNGIITGDYLESGRLFMRQPDASRTEAVYHIRFLDQSHLEMIMDLQQTTLDGLSRADMLQPFSRAFMREHLGDRGFIIGVLVGGRLVAFRNVYYPASDDEEWNLAADLGFPMQERARSANLQMVCVAPAFRGNQLTLKMNRIAIDRVRCSEKADHLLVTVSPYNFWNLRILINSGFAIRKLKNKYGGKLRFIVHQRFGAKYPPTSISSEDLRIVNLSDFETQYELLANGFIGTGFRKIKDCAPLDPSNLYKGFEVIYTRDGSASDIVSFPAR